MKKGQNTNHPAKGSQTTVEPIRKLKDIDLIKKLLADNPRDLALFTIGINTNLRAGDILKITAGAVRDLQVGDELTLNEGETGKGRRITLNKPVTQAIQQLLQSRPYQDTDFLFLGQRGVLTVPSVTRLVKGWCATINLKGNYGSHTLRKTFGYMQRTQHNTDIPALMEIFNHSTQRQTLKYLGIQPSEIRDIYLNMEL